VLALLGALTKTRAKLGNIASGEVGEAERLVFVRPFFARLLKEVGAVCNGSDPVLENCSSCALRTYCPVTEKKAVKPSLEEQVSFWKPLVETRSRGDEQNPRPVFSICNEVEYLKDSVTAG